MKAYEWIDRVKNKHAIPSDYAAAKMLGIGKQTISNYRAKQTTLDESAAISVAQALGMEPAGVILDQLAERVKNSEARTTLLAEARRLFILCKVTKRQIIASTKAMLLSIHETFTY